MMRLVSAYPYVSVMSWLVQVAGEVSHDWMLLHRNKCHALEN